MKSNRTKICCVFNLGPHYRSAIYTLMDAELDCDFYFGSEVNSSIKLMDYRLLKGFRKVLKRKVISRFKYYWLVGAVRLVFRPYDVYIISGEFKYLSNWFLLFMARVQGKRTLLWTHGDRGHLTGLSQSLHTIYHKLSSHVLLYGHRSRNIMVSKGFRPERLSVIYNSLDFKLQSTIYEGLNDSIGNPYHDYFNNKLPVLIYIGRLRKVKKLEMLIEALNILNQSGDTCNLVFVGKAFEEINLEEQVEKYRLNKYVWFYGECYEESTLGQLIYHADLCVSPGPVGLTAIHSLTFGTPVVSNNDFNRQMPEFEAIIAGESGDFFEVDNLSSLSDVIRTWIERTKSNRELVRMNCRRVIQEKYNAESQLEVLKSALRV